MDATVVELRRSLVGDTRGALLALAGAVACLLLVACANVANLLLARARQRRQELAVRLALGAGRPRLVRQVLTEGAALAVLGSLAGLLVAAWLLELFTAFFPDALPAPEPVVLDWRSQLFTLGLGLVTVLLFALAPALQGTGRGLGAHLRSGRASDDRPSVRFGKLLIAVEVALAVVLVIGATLTSAGLVRLLQVDPGFRTDDVVTLRLSLPESRYADVHETGGFYGRLLEDVRSLPGVRSAGAVGWLPLGGLWSCSFDIEGRPRATTPAEETSGLFRPVTSGYFETLGIPVLRGRAFDARDTADSPPVIVIDRALAERDFPGEDPIGRRLRFHCSGGEDPPRTIVGVVGEVRQFGLEEGGRAGYYIPVGQLHWDDMSLVIGVDGDPGPVVSAVRARVAELDPELAVSDVETLDARLLGSIERPRFQGLLFAAFAVLALVLGAFGVYSVVAYAVTRRRRELGIRTAVGARGGDLVRLVVVEGMVPVAVGAVVGLGLALGLARLLEGLVYGVDVRDPALYAVATAVLAVVALFACWLPARTAARVDVLAVLRDE